MSWSDLALSREKSRKLRAAVAWSCRPFFYSHKRNGSRSLHVGVCVSERFSKVYYKFITLAKYRTARELGTRSPCLYFLLCNFRFCYAFLFRLIMPYISFLRHIGSLLCIFTLYFSYITSFAYSFHLLFILTHLYGLWIISSFLLDFLSSTRLLVCS